MPYANTPEARERRRKRDRARYEERKSNVSSTKATETVPPVATVSVPETVTPVPEVNHVQDTSWLDTAVSDLKASVGDLKIAVGDYVTIRQQTPSQPSPIETVSNILEPQWRWVRRNGRKVKRPL